MKKERTNFDPQQIEALRAYLIATRQDFTIKVSNYTTEVITDEKTIKFIVEPRGPQAFIAGKKIAADISKHPKPDINVEELRYYLHRLKGSARFQEVIAIDIKSAYPTALYNAGFISTETLNYLHKIPKQDRLVATGLCASRKDIFIHKKGLKTDHIEEVNPLAPFFFYCVKTVGEIMTELKEIAGYNFLWSWVDCIYVNKGAHALQQIERIKEYLDALKYKYTVKTLTDVIIEDKKNFFFASYIDPEKGKKVFTIPKPDSNYKRALISVLSKTPVSEENPENLKNPETPKNITQNDSETPF